MAWNDQECYALVDVVERVIQCTADATDAADAIVRAMDVALTGSVATGNENDTALTIRWRAFLHDLTDTLDGLAREEARHG